MTVIDTCVLSSLAKIDRLDILRKAFKDIIATPSVVNEIEKVMGEAFMYFCLHGGETKAYK